ncbi:galactose-binding domain-containing protein [Streptomyces griseoruber]
MNRIREAAAHFALCDDSPLVDAGRYNPHLGSEDFLGTHPGANGTLTADEPTDGSPATRWAAAEDAAYPVTLDIGFGTDTTFDQVSLDEYTDSGTNPRVRTFALQRWDTGTGTWVTFASRDTGIGHDLTVTGFGGVTTSLLQVAPTGKIATEQYTPTTTEIAVYDG